MFGLGMKGERKMNSFRSVTIAGSVFVLLVLNGSSWAVDPTHTLLLDFDGDPNFPEYSVIGEGTTSPLEMFRADQLDATWGPSEQAQISLAVFQQTKLRFEEFDLRVTYTGMPEPLPSEFHTVGIDHRTAFAKGGGFLFGKADVIDNDATGNDFGRVWAGSFSQLAPWNTSTGNTKLGRYMRAMWNVTIHEAGHNYGLTHFDANPTAAEITQGLTTHDMVMATAANNQITLDELANDDLIIGDRAYRRLASNVGLRNESLTGWSFKNPNNTFASSFRIKFLSQNSSLTMTNWDNGGGYTGPPSFFSGQPTLVNTGLQSRDGVSWNSFELTFGNGPGVPAGTLFHTGVSFAEENDFLILDTELLDPGNIPLPLKPRTMSFGGSGYLSPDGKFRIPITNETDEPIILRDLRFRLAPRMTALDQLNELVTTPMTSDGLVVNFEDELFIPGDILLNPAEQFDVEIADLSTWLAEQIAALPGGGGGGGADSGNLNNPQENLPVGPIVGMFPDTYVFGEGTVIQPGQTVWDPDSDQFILEDLTHEVLFQIAGIQQVIIPEPSSLVLAALALCGLRMLSKRRSAGRQPC